ncbi:PucR family transcriptional regulator [Streptomyces hygroscopicus]|uniref:PucR family transcriptional regulator n=1 Tax=Streptomyces hygroscopicus TaxID=1912 RepID=UPI0008261732|nr:helix-turn-helix domain-containing protein [Streptomyces hygroscopicus]
MELVDVLEAIHAQLPRLGERIARRIRAEVPAYRDRDLIPLDSLRRSCTANADLVLWHLRRAGAEPDSRPAQETGRLRAEQGMPLADVLHAYRIGFEFVWAEILTEARARPGVPDKQLVDRSAEIWQLFGLYAEAVASAHRGASAELAVRRGARRSALVEALFSGVIADQTTLWDVARELGIPDCGPYAVVAAATDSPGTEPLPAVENSLHQSRLSSAWRLLPDQQIGLITLPTSEAEATLLRLLNRSSARVGVSPRFSSLHDTPQALRFARLALASLPGNTKGVTRFDDNPLAMLVAAAPAEAAQLTTAVLKPVLDLPCLERARLLDTLENWFAAGGSATTTAHRLYVHPNTVRYRLRQVERLTGRLLSDPRAVADVGAALLAARHPSVRGGEHVAGGTA